VRQARVVVIPLWAAHIGMSDSGVSSVFGLATAIDMAMFIPAGYVMDRFGRVWTAVPSAITLAAGAALLPAISQSWQVAAVALPLGFFAVGRLGAATAGTLYKFTPRWRLLDSSRA